MGWLISRVVSATLLVFLSAQLGMLLGSHWGVPSFGAALGASFCVAVIIAVESLRAKRLLRWLRSDRSGSAPRDPGIWGELGYRIERSFRKLDRRAAVESSRLDQFLSAIEVSPNGVLVLAPGDHIEWCNSSAAQHFGIDPVRDRHQRVTNLIRAPAFVACLQADEHSMPVTYQDPHRGSLRINIRAFGDGMKLVISQDVTESERNDAMRRDFVANVSHEIRTPLTVLAGFVETMSSLPLSEVERRRVIELMAQQTQRMHTLVADLLILAQLEGSPRPAVDHWVSVRHLLDQAHADAVALSAGRHRIEVNIAGSDQLAGTQAELASAVSNLVTNAVRYTPAGGTVDIGWARRDDGSAQIEVRDSGIGIDKAHLSRVTERFYRIDGSRSRDTGGTGLGLSIVKHVVQRHGGELEISSEAGLGSTFRLIFPAARVRSGALPEADIKSADSRLQPQLATGYQGRSAADSRT